MEELKNIKDLKKLNLIIVKSLRLKHLKSD